MFTNLANWLDDRTGFRKVLEIMLIEHIPGGAKWRYVWGSALAFVFAVQVITGVLLMTAYSPGDTTAWGSVYFIQYQMDFGWFIRGLHHFGSGTMVVLLGLHMLQVVIAGAQLPPREINWWLGLALMALTLAQSLTGYLLPWDQKGYWATQVATNIAGNIPMAGPLQQKVIVGGPTYGNATLTRFYALHTGIVPPLMIVLIAAHIAVFRRHGVTHPRNPRGEGMFWPDQAFRDMVVSLLVFGLLIAMVMGVFGKHGQPLPAPEGAKPPDLYQQWALAGRAGYGANLDAPADPGTASYPARPEWYFLPLFQLLKFFEGDREIVGTVIIPGAIGAVLFVLPLLAFGQKRESPRTGLRWFGHIVGVLAVGALLGGAGYLTFLAMDEDALRILTPKQIEEIANGKGSTDAPPDLTSEQQDAIAKLSEAEKARVKKAWDFNVEMERAELAARRAILLASSGIPVEGSNMLLRRDPATRGVEVFLASCGACHNHGSLVKSETATASDLAGFGTEAWIFGLLRNPGDKSYFGRTKLTAMDEAIKAEFANVHLSDPDAAKLGEDEKKTREQDLKDLSALAKWLAMHPRNTLRDADGKLLKESDDFKKGLELFESRGCATCHAFEGKGGRRGPDLTGYADAEWLRIMVMAPDHETRYGRRNTMPGFRELEGAAGEINQLELDRVRKLLKTAAGEDPKKLKEIEDSTRVLSMSDVDRELVIRFVIGDDRVVFGGDPIAAPPRR